MGWTLGMTRRPELKALEVFEAAARLGGFQKAARALGLTGSAVSHQIRLLEDLVGEPLFTRTGGAPVLTEAGEILGRRASAAFREIETGLDEVRARRADAGLCVSAPPHFAARFLVGRIECFAKRHPGIKVKLNVESRHVDFEREPVDLAVRFGSGAWAGLRAEMLFRPRVAAVCAPGVLAPGATARDLARQTWLRLSIEGDAAACYLAAAGICLDEPMAEVRFDTFVAALQAALDGQGVMLAPLESVQSLLAEGRLVRPFAVELPAAHGFHLVALAARFDQPHAVAFRRWLRGEVRSGAASVL
jgi:LysR family glycine cleavage system transcriptional activator